MDVYRHNFQCGRGLDDINKSFTINNIMLSWLPLIQILAYTHTMRYFSIWMFTKLLSDVGNVYHCITMI